MDQPVGNVIWSEDLIVKLIELYRDHRELWDFSHRNYRIQDIRNQSIDNIAQEIGASRNAVMKKIAVLMAQYRRERIQTRKEANGAPTRRYRVPWWAFKYFDFLATRPIRNSDHSGRKRKRIHFSDEEEESDRESESSHASVEDNAKNNTALQKSSKRDPDPLNIAGNSRKNTDNKTKRKTGMEKSDVLFLEPNNDSDTQIVENVEQEAEYPDGNNSLFLQQAFNMMNKTLEMASTSRDEIKVFVELVEHKLRKIRNPIKLCILKHDIEKLLHEAELSDMNNDQDPTELKMSEMWNN